MKGFPVTGLCQCTHNRRMRAEGKIVVCDHCGLPPSLPLCIDCKWYRNQVSRWIAATHICTYPLNEGIDLVTGDKTSDNFRLASEFRQDEGNKCGTRARYFERRDK